MMKPAQHVTRVIFFALLFTGSMAVAHAQPASGPERIAVFEGVAALNATIARSQVAVRQYEWIETTVIIYKGEEQSRKRERCFYGAGGALQRLEINALPPAEKKNWLHGKIVENKTAELTAYMMKAAELMKSYAPPNPAKIQAAKDAGRITVETLEPGKRARLNLSGYQKPGDNVSVEMDLVNNRALRMNVSTYLDNVKDIVTLDVRVGQLSDGTAYASDITLDATAKKLQATVQSRDYRKMN